MAEKLDGKSKDILAKDSADLLESPLGRDMAKK